jgi:hypothetical protein
LLKFKALFIKKEYILIKETFSVPDFLIELNLALKEMHITNLVKIAHDDIDFYLDNQHKLNDLDDAIRDFGFLIKNSFERFYEEISVLLEHKTNELFYVIEIILRRVHPVGQYPVQFIITCLPLGKTNKKTEQKIKGFVEELETKLERYVNPGEIKTSFIKKLGEEYSESEAGEEKEIDAQSVMVQEKKCIFFPLYGVMPGETTVNELAKLGTRAKDYDSDKKLYKYYTVQGMRFWFTGELTTHMYLTYTDPLPLQWRNCGFDWNLSYTKWKILLQKLGFTIADIKPPTVEWYSGKRTLSAEFMASKMMTNTISISFELDFNYSQRSSVDVNGTLYSISVRAQ